MNIVVVVVISHKTKSANKERALIYDESIDIMSVDQSFIGELFGSMCCRVYLIHMNVHQQTMIRSIIHPFYYCEKRMRG